MSLPTELELTKAVEIWKQIIAVQMHFNDIEMRIRNLYVTVVLAIVGATGWVIDKKLMLHLSVLRVHFAVAILMAGVLVSYLFYFMDRYWYHQLLKGAVDQGRVLDRHYADAIPALGLTSQISGASPIAGFRTTIVGRLLAALRVISTPKKDERKDDLHSTGKIELFYKTVIYILSFSILLSMFFGGVTVSGKSLSQIVLDALQCRGG